MWPVSKMGTLIFVAVFNGPVIVLKSMKFIYKYHQYIHCSICPSPFFEKVQFLPWTNIFVFGRKRVEMPIITLKGIIVNGKQYDTAFNLLTCSWQETPFLVRLRLWRSLKILHTLLLLAKSKSHWCTNKSQVKDPSINTWGSSTDG